MNKSVEQLRNAFFKLQTDYLQTETDRFQVLQEQTGGTGLIYRRADEAHRKRLANHALHRRYVNMRCTGPKKVIFVVVPTPRGKGGLGRGIPFNDNPEALDWVLGVRNDFLTNTGEVVNRGSGASFYGSIAHVFGNAATFFENCFIHYYDNTAAGRRLLIDTVNTLECEVAVSVGSTAKELLFNWRVSAELRRNQCMIVLASSPYGGNTGWSIRRVLNRDRNGWIRSDLLVSIHRMLFPNLDADLNADMNAIIQDLRAFRLQ